MFSDEIITKLKHFDSFTISDLKTVLPNDLSKTQIQNAVSRAVKHGIFKKAYRVYAPNDDTGFYKDFDKRSDIPFGRMIDNTNTGDQFYVSKYTTRYEVVYKRA